MLWVSTANNNTHTHTHTTTQRDMQRLFTDTATPKTATYKNATRTIQVISTKESSHTQTGTEEERGEERRQMEIGWQHPDVFPGGPPPQF